MSSKAPREGDESPVRGSIIPEGMMPSYLAEAFGELYEEDGLLVLGKGLGLSSLVAAFIRFYADVEEGHVALMMDAAKEPNFSRPDARKPPLVFVLGLREAEYHDIVFILETWGCPPELLPTMITNESGSGKDRAVLYQKGGVFAITSRILIVDLLTNIARAKSIDGILVAHAEQVTEQSSEAFILRIFRTQSQLEGNRRTFVKAFSDQPDALLRSFAKVDKILKALYVRRLFLYPRFHSSVAEELEQKPPHVDELHQDLSQSMKEIQSAIAAAVQACIRELKKSTSLLEWTDSELSVENCVTSNFDRAISRQLEHDWHRLKPQTKQLVSDLRQLRSLFQYLIHYDCVTFWKLINSIKTMSAGSRSPSMWLLTPAADNLFRAAKQRLYTILKPQPTERVPNPLSRLKPVLEENPKWRLLRQVLDEIQHVHHSRKRTIEDESICRRPINVLVMVKDERTLESVRSYLVDGKEKTMALRWLRYLESYNDRSRSVAGSAGGTSAISEESRLLLEEEGRIRNFLFGKRDNPQWMTSFREGRRLSGPSLSKRKRLNEVSSHVRKRRRIATEIRRGEQMFESEDLKRHAVLDEAVEEAESELNKLISSRMQLDSDLDGFVDDEAMFEVAELEELRLVVRSLSSFDGDQAALMLQDLEPSHIVMYDATASFVRATEIYSTLREDEQRLHVYVMMFVASAEEKSFMKSLEREQTAFERLIHHKKTMPLPVHTLEGTTQEIQHAFASGAGVAGTYADGCLPLSIDTRKGRGKARDERERREIAVDVREFRSALPSILHNGGMRLAPVTLTVGDFVLSSVHCVERKSISDLFGSFNSGRLYVQAESMSKHYKCPCLLIEFDPAKSFCLQNSNELGVEIRTDAISSKMTLLIMHFPKLRILWSRSAHETLRIFRSLKASHDEPNVGKAIEIGRNDSVDLFLREGVDDDDNDNLNEVAREMLLRLPGVSMSVSRRLMRECDTVAQLSEMSRERLREIAGPVSGQKLFTFFRQKMAAT